MCRRDGQRAITHLISLCAENLEVRLRVGRDATIVLLVLRVPEEHDAFNLVADCGGEFGDCAGDDGGALAVQHHEYVVSEPWVRELMREWREMGKLDLRVSTCNDNAVGALGVSEVEKTNSLIESCLRRSTGQEVGQQVGGVWAADALDPDVGGTIVCLEGVGEGNAGAASLWSMLGMCPVKIDEEKKVTKLTRFPPSVLPRA